MGQIPTYPALFHKWQQGASLSNDNAYGNDNVTQ